MQTLTTAALVSLLAVGTGCGGDGGAGADPTVDAAPGCTTAGMSPGVYTGQRLIQDDAWRTYTLSIPEGAALGAELPVVFVFHDADSSSSTVRAYLPIEAEVGAPSVFVYPNATDAGWDVTATGDANADLALTVALLDELDARACVDRSRVFASGFGAGASFVNHLACERGELLRAIAPVSGSGPDAPPSRRDDTGHVICPGTPPQAFIVHGNADTQIPNPTNGTLGGWQSFRHWAYWGQTNPDPAYAYPTENSPPAPCVRAVGLPETHRVYGCFVDGLGHAPWPSAAGSIRAFFGSRR